ncbi:MAG: DUF342 domain-containing protein [Planctomycetota bacterium]
MSDNGTDFNLRLSEDRMSVLLDCALDGVNAEELAAGIDEELARMGALNAPARVALKEALENAITKSSGLRGFPVARGEKPVPSVHGAVTWAREFFSTGFAMDPKTGAINYRQRAANLAVERDEVLAQAVLPEDGKEGRDVLGRPIRVRPPRPIPIHAGANVIYDESRQVFLAAKSGRVRLSGRVLVVDNVYEVPGNVGLASGDIQHPGSIIVRGDIDANSTVEVEGDIEVYGTVESADLTAGGSITVRGGIMNGHGKLIKAGGSVHASFVIDCTIEAGGDVVAEKEIVQCTLKVRGAVVIPMGRIVGGETLALGGIVAGQAGSEAAVKTLLAPGNDYLFDREVAWRRRKAQECWDKAGKVTSQTKALMAQTNVRSPAQREKTTELLAAASELVNTSNRLSREADDMETESRAKAIPRAVINGLLCQDTVFRIRRNELKIKESCRGPLCALRHKQAVILKPIENAQVSVKAEDGNKQGRRRRMPRAKRRRRT